MFQTETKYKIHASLLSDTAWCWFIYFTTYNFVFEMVALKKKENVLKYMANRRQKNLASHFLSGS